jgi:glutamine---fructose-6-phosphate transaminase (isomerizing)
MSVLDEIREQPQAIASAVSAAQRVLPEVRALLERSPWHYAVIAARGTSDNAAVFAQYLWGARNQLSVALATPSLYANPPTPHLDGAAVFGISQSGRSPDLVNVLRAARVQRRPAIAITNDPSSPLADAADVVVPLEVGAERSIAATKTFTGQLAAVSVLCGALPGGTDAAIRQLAQVPSAVESVLDRVDVSPVVDGLKGHDRAAIVGRGLDLAVAREWALKLQELSGLLAHAWSTADFKHGPMALAEFGMPVIIIATDPAHVAEDLELAELVRTRGRLVAVLSDQDAATVLGEAIALPATGQPGAAFTATVAAQLATVAVARQAGRDPDHPPGLNKVTETQ